MTDGVGGSQAFVSTSGRIRLAVGLVDATDTDGKGETWLRIGYGHLTAVIRRLGVVVAVMVVDILFDRGKMVTVVTPPPAPRAAMVTFVMMAMAFVPAMVLAVAIVFAVVMTAVLGVLMVMVAPIMPPVMIPVCPGTPGKNEDKSDQHQADERHFCLMASSLK